MSALALPAPTVSRLRSAGAVLGVLVVWELAARLFVPGADPIIPPPTMLVAYFFGHFNQLLVAIQPTLVEATAGFVIGAGISVAFAMLFVRYKPAEAALNNALVLLHSLPMLAIIPLLVIWFGIGYTPKIIIAALATFFPVLNGAQRGLESAEPGTLELMHLLDASWLQTLVKVRIPASLPHIFAGLKIAAPQAVLGATVAEWIGSRAGLGSQILMSLLNYDVPLLWSCMVACALMAAAAYGILAGIEYLLVGRRAPPAGGGS